jgi:hypothetical protein
MYSLHQCFSGCWLLAIQRSYGNKHSGPTLGQNQRLIVPYARKRWLKLGKVALIADERLK